MKKVIYIIIILLAIFLFDYFWQSSKNIVAIDFESCSKNNPVMESYPRQCIDSAGNHFVEDVQNNLEKINLIQIFEPFPNQKIKSPLVIKGEARGYWFFEASFPIVLVDWDGKIIAEGHATAQKEWMTKDMVPFEAKINFEKPEMIGDFSKKGSVILKKDNPSGLSENDDAFEIPIVFE